MAWRVRCGAAWLRRRVQVRSDQVRCGSDGYDLAWQAGLRRIGVEGGLRCGGIGLGTAGRAGWAQDRWDVVRDGFAGEVCFGKHGWIRRDRDWHGRHGELGIGVKRRARRGRTRQARLGGWCRERLDRSWFGRHGVEGIGVVGSGTV